MYDNTPFAIPDELLQKRLLQFIESDIGFGDLSSGLIPKDEKGEAKISAKSEGIVAGVDEAHLIFRRFGISTNIKKKDGDTINKGEVLMILHGNIRNMLMAERTALNFLMKMSAIATSTADYVNKARKAGFNTRIAATRKTTPGFGWFEKKAVHLGGGDTHRWNLSEMVLLKDTHRKYYNEDIKNMLSKVREKISFSKKIEVEIENPDDIGAAIDNGADIIMLDNMTPEQITSAINSHEKPRYLLYEASGNITFENFMDYVKSGVDIISTSQTILNPHKTVDYSLRLS